MLGPRNAPTSLPAGRDEAPERRQSDVDVEVPQGARHRRSGYEELERGQTAAWPHDARQLAERRCRIVDVAKQVGEGQPVEARVGEVERLGPPLDELDPVGEARARDSPPAALEHLDALVDADDGAAVAPGELDCDRCGSRRDVEHACRPGARRPVTTRNRRQRGSWPKLKRCRVPVVGAPERCEQLPGPTVALGLAHGHVSILAVVSLEEELSAAASAAEAFLDPGEELAGVVAAEPADGLRLYLCAYRVRRAALLAGARSRGASGGRPRARAGRGLDRGSLRARRGERRRG